MRAKKPTFRIALDVIPGKNYANYYGGHYRTQAAAEKAIVTYKLERFNARVVSEKQVGGVK